MKVVKSASIGLIALAAIAAAHWQGILGKSALSEAPTQPPPFGQLTEPMQQKAAALKQFGSKLTSTSSAVAANLTPQTPYNAGMDASLNVSGSCQVQAATAWNRVEINAPTTFLVLVGRADPSKTYMVTFNLRITNTIDFTMLTGKTNTASGKTALNPIQPTGKMTGSSFAPGTTVSIPVVILPGSNTAELVVSSPSLLGLATFFSANIEAM